MLWFGGHNIAKRPGKWLRLREWCRSLVVLCTFVSWTTSQAPLYVVIAVEIHTRAPTTSIRVSIFTPVSVRIPRVHIAVGIQKWVNYPVELFSPRLKVSFSQLVDQVETKCWRSPFASMHTAINRNLISLLVNCFGYQQRTVGKVESPIETL